MCATEIAAVRVQTMREHKKQHGVLERSLLLHLHAMREWRCCATPLTALHKQLYKLEREHMPTTRLQFQNSLKDGATAGLLLLKALIMLFNGLVAILLDLKYTVI